ncbi:YeeE/YedE thiosulfate transporter family protein [Hydrogenophaga sp. 5NK40-0174]|uniref:YeeE/YedE family protein n=1 Tax=Hydrogenophaga sp. 5NK40-0174 TaxID=3127649 RepID=UPI0031064DFC
MNASTVSSSPGWLEMLFPLGWTHYLVGGLCIGLGVALLFWATGRIGGMSSVYSSTWSFVIRRPFFQQARFTGSRQWRLVYAAGLMLGALVWWLFFSDGTASSTQVPVWQLLVGGFLVGYGARRGNGCTSGHGICGMGALQWPSALAVLTFMATAFITANLMAWITA